MASRRAPLKGGFDFHRGKHHRQVEVREGAGDGYEERQHQEAVIDWKHLTLSLLRGRDEAQRERLRWLHSSLNGVYLGATQTRKAVASGMTKGVPDLFLPCAKRDESGAVVSCGLYIEMKRKAGGRLTPEQKEFAEHARREGYRVETVYTWQDAARLIVDYLGLETYAPLPRF